MLQSAADEAEMLRSDEIGTEHLLLGLLHEPESVAMSVLQSLDVEPAAVRAAVEARTISRTSGHDHARGLTPASKKALHLSIEEASRLRHSFVGTEHILLGLARQGDGIAAEVITQLAGVDLAELRRRVVDTLRKG